MAEPGECFFRHFKSLWKGARTAWRAHKSVRRMFRGNRSQYQPRRDVDYDQAPRVWHD
ncbi:hypothetical protein NQZ68_018472 [Dissostichus eleginoides]|nr:hypothetical protein NQZ68_018469 [Dissostichus eleginoides]KAI9547253.1 hypothetical protein NQZ68_018472 [Dissostichus eleginoides]